MKIKEKKRKQWIDQDHVLTPVNMMKMEFGLVFEVKKCIYRLTLIRFKPRALRRGKVIWVIKEGKRV